MSVGSTSHNVVQTKKFYRSFISSKAILNWYYNMYMHCNVLNEMRLIDWGLAPFLTISQSYHGSSPTHVSSPSSSVGSDAGYQSRGCEFESQLGQLSFGRLTKSQCDMRHSFSTNGLSLCGKATSCLERLLCGVLVRKKQEMHE